VNLDEVTVIVPTRNEAANIPAFLSSLPPGISLIAVDSSDDATPHLIEMNRPERTLVIRKHCNVTEARQAGAASAHTPLLLFTDADVMFREDYFENLSSYREYDALYGPKISRDEFSAYYHRFSRWQRMLHALGIPAASGSNLLIRREVLDAVGGFDLTLNCNEDSEIAWRIKRHGYRVGLAADLVVYARDHRRLYRGRMRKTAHSLTRCALLYLNLMPAQWRSRDWGYWSSKPEKTGQGGA